MSPTSAINNPAHSASAMATSQTSRSGPNASTSNSAPQPSNPLLSSQSAYTGPISLRFCDDFKSKLEAWAVDKPLSDPSLLHLDSCFHQVFSASKLHVSNSARVDVGTTMSLVFELVEADRGYLPALKLLVALPRLLLFPTSPKHSLSNAEQLRERCRLLLSGELHVLWGSFDQLSAKYAYPTNERTEDEAAAFLGKQMEHAIDDNMPSKSIQHLVSTGMATGPEVPSLIQAKCPQPEVPFNFEADASVLFPVALRSGSCQPTGPSPWLANEQKRIVRKWEQVLRQEKKRVAPAGDGWRVEHLQLAFEFNKAAVSNVLEQMSNFLMPAEFMEHCSATAAMAFLKKDPKRPDLGPHLGDHGVRPIGKPQALGKVAAKPLVAEATKRNKIALAECGQMGGGVSAGIEVVPRAVQALIEMNPDLAVWSKDIRNAFNTLNRDCIADCLKDKDPALYRYFIAHYRKPRKQFMRGHDGKVIMIGFSSTGLSQGDVCASIIFDVVYTAKVLKPTLDAHPDVTLAAIHDDTYMVALPEHLPSANATLVGAAAALDLNYAPDKEAVLQLPRHDRPEHLSLTSYRSCIDVLTEFKTDTDTACHHIGGVPCSWF
jgi:hypothetical protein